MKRPINNWNIGPFLRWWDKQEEEGNCQRNTKTQMAYIAWEAAIDYYIDKLKEEEASLKETKNERRSI